MRRLLILCIALALVSSFATTQVAGKHNGLFIGTSIYTTMTSAVGEYTPQNTWVMYPTNMTQGPWTHWGNMWHAAQDTDNQSVITYALVGAGPTDYAFVQWDPIAGGVVGTIWQAPFATRYPLNVTDITVDSNGDIVGYDSQVNQVVRYDRFAGKWVGTTINVNLSPNGGLGGVEWDKVNGGFLIANSRATAAPYNQVLIRLSADQKTPTVIAVDNSATGNVRANMGGTMLDDGTWVSSSYTSFQYHEVKAGTTLWTAGPVAASLTTTDVGHEYFAAAGRGYYAILVGGTTVIQHAIAHVDATTTPHTYTNLAAPATLPNGVTGWAMEAMPLYQRGIATHRTGKGTWDIYIKPDPQGTFAGKSYVVAASLAGGRPAIPLPDGREIFLVPDVLTVATAMGPFPPFLTGNVGVLDPFGRATAKLNLGALGTTANGNVIHFCGVVIDAAAPGGIGWVFDPWAFSIDVLP